MASKTNLFLYGTLKRGQPNHHLLTDTEGSAEYCFDAVSVDEYPLVICTKYNVPMALKCKGVGKVRGEEYCVVTHLLFLFLDRID